MAHGGHRSRLCLAGLLGLLGCSDSDSGLEREGFNLVWNDEFDGDAGRAPHDSNWNYDIGGHGWGNNQLEYNTDSTDNVFLDGNGYLNIVAREQAYEGNAYTSGRIHTKDKAEFGYGRVEASIQVPRGEGLWPAFWMLGTDFPQVTWPNSGEIDIMEFDGGEPGAVYGTVHGPGYSGGNGVGAIETLYGRTFDREHYRFAIERDPGRIAWFINDDLFFELDEAGLEGKGPWVFDQDFFVILNLAVGGNFVSPPRPDTEFPAVLSIDYVRYYERK